MIIIPQSPNTLLKILQTPSLPKDNPRSYQLTTSSEAWNKKAGAYIDFSVHPWTKWFGEETCSNGATEKCKTENKSNGTRTCSSGIWGSCTATSSCNDSDGDGYGNSFSDACEFSGIDCVDSNPNINPGILEICENGLDDDCSAGDKQCGNCFIGASTYTPESSVWAFIYPEGCKCDGENKYVGYCCENGYNAWLPCGFEACKANTSCTTLDNCTGTCNSLGTECIDITTDGCPNYVLQQGLAGYNGTIDSKISNVKPTTPEGTLDYVSIITVPAETNEHKTLIKFDLTNLPQDLTIQDCILQFYITSEESPYWAKEALDRAKYMNVSVRKILKNWSENTVTWNSPWTTPGADAEGIDRSAQILDFNPIANADVNVHTVSKYLYNVNKTWVKFALPSSVCQDWLNNSSNNFGLLLEFYMFNKEYAAVS